MAQSPTFTQNSFPFGALSHEERILNIVLEELSRCNVVAVQYKGILKAIGTARGRPHS